MESIIAYKDNRGQLYKTKKEALKSNLYYDLNSLLMVTYNGPGGSCGHTDNNKVSIDQKCWSEINSYKIIEEAPKVVEILSKYLNEIQSYEKEKTDKEI